MAGILRGRFVKPTEINVHHLSKLHLNVDAIYVESLVFMIIA